MSPLWFLVLTLPAYDPSIPSPYFDYAFVVGVEQPVSACRTSVVDDALYCRSLDGRTHTFTAIRDEGWAKQFAETAAEKAARDRETNLWAGDLAACVKRVRRGMGGEAAYAVTRRCMDARKRGRS